MARPPSVHTYFDVRPGDVVFCDDADWLYPDDLEWLVRIVARRQVYARFIFTATPKGPECYRQLQSAGLFYHLK